jgi:membrane-associated phospholipid phosphatase
VQGLAAIFIEDDIRTLVPRYDKCLIYMVIMWRRVWCRYQDFAINIFFINIFINAFNTPQLLTFWRPYICNSVHKLDSQVYQRVLEQGCTQTFQKFDSHLQIRYARRVTRSSFNTVRFVSWLDSPGGPRPPNV